MIFWDKIINTFHLKHLEIDLPRGIDFFWSTRMVSPNEIKFREIRRLHLYNTGSSKKSFKVKLKSNVSLVKIAEEYKGKVKVKEQSFEAEIGPIGSIGIDFGIWS